MEKLKISIASDHRGFALKENIKASLKDITFVDYGTTSDDSTDYPDYAYLAAQAVAKNECEMAIVICGSGIGVSIVANKIKGIRCALIYKHELAKASRNHDHANALALSSDYTSLDEALKIIDVFINSEYEGERHQRRVDKISNIEKEQYK